FNQWNVQARWIFKIGKSKIWVFPRGIRRMEPAQREFLFRFQYQKYHIPDKTQVKLWGKRESRGFKQLRRIWGLWKSGYIQWANRLCQFPIAYTGPSVGKIDHL